MHGQLCVHGLEVAIRARVEIRPADVCRVAVVGRRQRAVDVVRMKDVGRTDGTHVADRAAEIHMVARDHDAAATLAEPQDSFAIGIVEPVARIHCEQPQLVVLRAIERGQNRVRFTDGITIPRRDVEQSAAIGCSERSEVIPQHREATDVPVVRGRLDRRLQQQLDGLHLLTP